MLKPKAILGALLGGLIVTTSLPAAIYHDIDTSQPLKCSLSSTHQNRIAVVDGEIQKLVFDSSLLRVEIDSVCGQVFLFPLKPFSDPTTISVITKNGAVQDIEVILEDKSSEVIILREPPEQPALMQGVEGRYDQIVSRLRLTLEGRAPAGFFPRALGMFPDHTFFKSTVTLEPIHVFEGPVELISVVRIHNEGKEPIEIDEKDFRTAGDHWIYLDAFQIPAGEYTRAVFCSRKV